ncbi:hypothetical protein [Bacillus taeanensis]|uniref:Sporulation protein n=1 Tax=Bacillus taeanensis TaxID=273032 RepID=A0A366XRD9_9BACI|nr:hypothetical protein [Bacillus taeanensis]RBW68702.1 hypothetical protein DS031_15215 [Bacillus taeanensis]
MKIMCAFTLTAVLLLGACSPVEPPQAQSNDTTGVLDVGYNNQLNNEEELDEISDGGRGVQYSFDTNQNPHHYRNLSDKRFTISDDQDKIRALVNRTNFAKPTTVSIVGNHAWVNVTLTGNPSKAQRQNRIQELEQAIQQEVPRYRIHLRVNNN